MYVAINNQDLPMLSKNDNTESKNNSAYSVHVGFFKPNGFFHTTKTFKNQTEAHKFIRYLHGGELEE